MKKYVNRNSPRCTILIVLKHAFYVTSEKDVITNWARSTILIVLYFTFSVGQ